MILNDILYTICSDKVIFIYRNFFFSSPFFATTKSSSFARHNIRVDDVCTRGLLPSCANLSPV